MSKAIGINPEILIWARERAGYSLEDVSARMKKDVEIVQQWESGVEVPTYRQLETMAYSLYKRPIAVFFFPFPPTEPDLKQSFRTLPDFELNNLLPNTRYTIRQAMAMQITLKEVNDGTNPSDKKIFRDIVLDANQDVAVEAARVRDYLGIQLEGQKSWKSITDALEAWREIIQDYGIFIFKHSFKQNDVSGISFLDDEFPIIYLNNSTTKSRQIFTIFHELAHLLLKTNGITKDSDSYISALKGRDRDIEIFCNRFAAEFLVPSLDFERSLNGEKSIDRAVEVLSDRYKVSREVILRKLLDRGTIDRAYYEDQVNQWFDEFQEGKAKGSGGNYYYTQMAYLGDRFLELAFDRYHQGRCSLEQLSGYLNVKAKNIGELEQFMYKKAAAR